MSNNPSAEGAEPAVRDMDAWAEAAGQMAQGANGAEPPTEPVEAEADQAASEDSWQHWGWWQGARGDPSAEGVWDTQWASRGTRDSEWGSLVGWWWGHGSRPLPPARGTSSTRSPPPPPVPRLLVLWSLAKPASSSENIL